MGPETKTNHPKDYGKKHQLDKIKTILETEFSEDFVQKMKNRMVAGFYKYGPVKLNPASGADLADRLELYMKTGNTEWLVDVANFAMIEFMHPQHEKAHFRATDSEESPGVRGTTVRELEKRKE